MYLHTFEYVGTVYHRVQDPVYKMDSNFSHTSEEKQYFRVVTPGNERHDEEDARTLLGRYCGNNTDKAFKILGHDSRRVHAILQAPLTRL